MEYEPEPPFRSGRPELAPPPVLEAARKILAVEMPHELVDRLVARRGFDAKGAKASADPEAHRLRPPLCPGVTDLRHLRWKSRTFYQPHFDCTRRKTSKCNPCKHFLVHMEVNEAKPNYGDQTWAKFSMWH
jgi:hypothetical protein